MRHSQSLSSFRKDPLRDRNRRFLSTLTYPSLTVLFSKKKVRLMKPVCFVKSFCKILDNRRSVTRFMKYIRQSNQECCCETPSSLRKKWSLPCLRVSSIQTGSGVSIIRHVGPELRTRDYCVEYENCGVSLYSRHLTCEVRTRDMKKLRGFFPCLPRDPTSRRLSTTSGVESEVGLDVEV